MKKLNSSDIPLFSSIKGKQYQMDLIQQRFYIDFSDSPDDDPSQLGYALMEQLDTLNQIKGLESSICNDSHDDL